MELRRMHVCHDCVIALRNANATNFLRSATPRLATASRKSITSSTHAYSGRASKPRAQPTCTPPIPTRIPRRALGQTLPARTYATSPTPDLNAVHARIQSLCASVLKPDDGKLPSEQRVLYVLEQLQAIANTLADERFPDRALNSSTKPAPAPEPASKKERQETATSALLGSVNSRQQPSFITKASILTLLSEKAFDIVRHPDVFITPAVLKAYVELQSSLQQPWSFPDIFEAYANKPAPTMKGDTVEYTPVSPDHINAAIDRNTANTALSAAMLAHNLPLAIDIITTSFSAPAFKKAKFLRQAAVPLGGLAVAPLAAYTLSSSFSNLQQTMDPSMATGIAFAGIMTYVGAVSMVGYITITTANDQMDRVTWASGVPLWERWLREDERASADRLASAWGFKDRDKRGEEEGDDWEALREWVGRRGMVLDRVNLMEGME